MVQPCVFTCKHASNAPKLLRRCGTELRRLATVPGCLRGVTGSLQYPWLLAALMLLLTARRAQSMKHAERDGSPRAGGGGARAKGVGEGGTGVGPKVRARRSMAAQLLIQGCTPRRRTVRRRNIKGGAGAAEMKLRRGRRPAHARAGRRRVPLGRRARAQSGPRHAKRKDGVAGVLAQHRQTHKSARGRRAQELEM